jgi:UDP-N-acetylmuramate dehydrogenase
MEPADLERIADRLRARVSGSVETEAPLAPFTTFRVGGPAAILLEAGSDDDLRALADERGDAPVAIVGRGSNLLVSDDGFRGIAVRLGRPYRDHSATGTELTLGGAVHLPAAARLTSRLGLSGFEFAAEIPGAFGGAVRMNAGAHGRCMADVLVDCTVVDLATGDARVLAAGELAYAYRHSSLGAEDLVTGGRLLLERGDGGEIAATISSFLRWRREHQPAGRSAGSVFKNPDGDSAGRLIDEAGGKGMAVGGAEVSGVHANFIVVAPGARAADVWTLIRRLQRIVADRAGVVLEPEVRFLGRFPDVEG